MVEARAGDQGDCCGRDRNSARPAQVLHERLTVFQQHLHAVVEVRAAVADAQGQCAGQAQTAMSQADQKLGVIFPRGRVGGTLTRALSRHGIW